MDQLEELIKDMLWYVFSYKAYTKTYGETKIELYGPMKGEDYGTSELFLDNKKIAGLEINPEGRVTVGWVRFHDRYDITIRSIFQALDVEVVKFGKTWLGYPHEAGEMGIRYPSSSQGDWEPSERILARKERQRIDQEEQEKFKKALYSTTAYTSTNHIQVGERYSISTSNWYAAPSISPTAGTTPSNPILAQAQQRGMTQRQIEQLAQRGRVR